jgi:hypothetical protein
MRFQIESNRFKNIPLIPKSSAISSIIDSATFESSEYDLLSLGDGDRRLRPGDNLSVLRGLGDGVRRRTGGLFCGDGERP